MAIYIGGSSGTDQIQIVTTTPSTVTGWGYFVKCDASSLSSTLILNLPTAVAKSGQKITISKIDGSNNPIQILPFSGQTINGNSNIYLYNNSDSIVLQSDGSNYFVVSDNRNSTGSTASYLYATMTSVQSDVIAGTSLVKYTKAQSLIGNKISLNTSTGIITVQPNSTYSVKACFQYALSGASAYISGSIQVSTDQVTWTDVSKYEQVPSAQVWASPDPSPIGWYSFTPTVTTYIRNLVAENAGVSQIGFIDSSSHTNSLPWCEVREETRQTTVINTVDNISLTKSTVTSLSGATDIIFDKYTGNMTYNPSTGLVTLITGKTYLIQAGIRQTTASTATDYGIYDSSNNLINANAIGSANSNNAQGDCIISFNYTPTTNIQIKLRNGAGTGTAGANQQWMTVTQIGSTATTNIPTNLLGNDVVTTTGIQILTTKTLDDTTTFFADTSDNTKKLNFNVGGTTGITGTISSNFTTAKTLTLPDATDTLVGKNTTDILTNKTMDSSNVYYDVKPKTTNTYAIGTSALCYSKEYVNNVYGMTSDRLNLGINDTNVLQLTYDSSISMGYLLPYNNVKFGTGAYPFTAMYSKLFGSGGNPLLFSGGSDSTKIVNLDTSLITTGTTRTIKTPNKDGTIALLSDLGQQATYTNGTIYNTLTDPFGTTNPVPQATIQNWFDTNGGYSTDTISPLSIFPNLPVVANGYYAVWLGNTTWYYKQSTGTTDCWNNMTAFGSGGKTQFGAIIKCIALGSLSAPSYNCIDIGAIRIQWGNSATGSNGAQTITLPASFANTSYSVTCTPNATNTSGLFSTVVTSKTTSQFSVYKTFYASSVGTYGETFNWIAMGMKP